MAEQIERDWIIVSEQWKAIPSFPDYEASTRGNVRRRVGGPGASAYRPLLKFRDRDRYPRVGLQRDGKSIQVCVHWVTAEAFHGPRPPGTHVSHLDGNRANPCPHNLAYESPSANQLRRREHGTDARGERNPSATLTNKQVLEIKSRISGGESLAEIGRDYGVSRQVIWFIKHEYTWGHIQ